MSVLDSSAAFKNVEVMAELQNKKLCNLNKLMLEINTHLFFSLNFDHSFTDRRKQFLNGTMKIVCKNSWSLDFTFKTSNDVTDVNKRACLSAAVSAVFKK